MNRPFAILLALTFFVAIGGFNIAKGISSIRSRRQSTIVGWMRIVLGVLMFGIVVPLFLFLRQG